MLVLSTVDKTERRACIIVPFAVPGLLSSRSRQNKITLLLSSTTGVLPAAIHRTPLTVATA